MRAKSHDIRKGQWLINKIRFDNPKYMTDFDSISSVEDHHFLIESIIWNMENDEYDSLMSEYDK